VLLPVKLSGRSASFSDSLDLPSLFRVVTLREAGNAFTHAQNIASEAGAGTLVRVGRFGLVEFAVVLEPDEALWSVRRVFYAGMLALRSALATYAPPQCPVTFGWPDAIQVDGGLIGGAQLAWPTGSDEYETPDWLVFGVMLRWVAREESGTGLCLDGTTLIREGFEDTDSNRLIENCARHLLLAIDGWQRNAFGAVANSYLKHLDHENGTLPTIDDNGDFLLSRRNGQEPIQHSIAQALAVPSWLDPLTGGPRA
jgi:hypothetical protein